jgi:hypothetical protein
VKRFRTIAAAAIAASVLVIPATAHAAGGNCVGTTMQLVHSQLREEAKGGAVHDLVQNLRTEPDLYPWCDG